MNRYIDYSSISSTFTGWTLTEIKMMPVPERRFWSDVADYRNSK